jgi:cell wall integrity and stress response component
MGYSVMAMTGGNDCWCGNELPANSTKTDTCTDSCDGWQEDACKYLLKLIKPKCEFSN